VAFMVLPTGLQAAPFTVSWDGTISEVQEAGSTGVSVGDPFTFSFTMDNGGTTALSQTWGLGDFVSASINVNTGLFVDTDTNTDHLFSAGYFQGSGGGYDPGYDTFTTDAVGNLTKVAFWYKLIYPCCPDASPYAEFGIINTTALWAKFNGAYFSEGVGQPYLFYFRSLGVSERPLSDWDHSWATIPEPSSLALVGLGAIALLGYRRCERRSDEKSKEAA